MPRLNRRTHILFDEDSYEWLRERATASGTSVGEIVRNAIERERRGDLGRRRAAADALLRAKPMHVDDWEVMERELAEDMYGPGED